MSANINDMREVTGDELRTIHGGWSVSVMILMQWHKEALGYTEEQAHEYAASLTPTQRA
jgi:hypothetical protein